MILLIRKAAAGGNARPQGTVCPEKTLSGRVPELCADGGRGLGRAAAPGRGCRGVVRRPGKREKTEDAGAVFPERKSGQGVVFRIADRFVPFAFGVFSGNLHGEMYEPAVFRRAVPVLDARRNVDHVAGM